MVSLLSPKEARKIKSIKIHPAANSAFEFVKSLEFLFSDAIRKDLFNVDILNEGAILRGIVIETELHIFSGFESRIFDLNNLNRATATILIHKDITKSEIELFAWKAVISNCLLNSVSSEYLDLIHTNINERIPSSVSNILYFKSHLSEVLLADMTGKTKDTIAKQKSRHNQPQQGNPISIFEQVIEEVNHY
ncbi:hypothetical protein [Shewanella sp. 10N.286.52.B9]|uniref:hypothetical protein n=1 Tax=Shewanella sp. 10N.286.52.B9 TaxID=1880837 RepID=UPI000C828EC7|nr:hypothetical protein [Shewanella sp. 10N.286.52.B9]PMG50698.1 hypothetical protein BCU91_17260 [Shewanella sp. 10N.286.52.B9]